MFTLLKNLNFFYDEKIIGLIMTTFISEPNKHIEEYLDDYCKSDLNDYAVFINGRWGSGKTWFINQIEDKLKKKYKRVIYISLNGIAKKDVVDDEIFCALHPVLSHKATKFFGKVAAGLVKASTKIDIAGDNKKETSLSISLPNIDVNSLMNSDEKLILIFDDLERCLLPIPEIFGYINYFVEHTKSKAIIVGNEAEIQNKDNDKKYSTEKEKLIGTTFEFHGDVKSALKFFIASIDRKEVLPSNDIKFMLRNRIELILEVYELSKHKNIRTLKQSLNEFIRFYDEKFFKDDQDVFDDELFNEILKYYLIFSLEQRNGTLNLEYLNLEEKEKVKEFYTKYNFNEYSTYIFNIKTWINIIKKNVIQKEIIMDELKGNYFIYKRDKPDWYKLSSYYDLTNDDFEKIFNSAIDKLENLEYKDFGEVVHVVAAILFFNDKSLKKSNLNEIENYALKNISKICEEKDREYRVRFKDPLFNDSWGGRTYLNFDAANFKCFQNIVFKTIAEFELSTLKDRAQELLELVKNDQALFYHRISLTNSKENLFFEIPVLKEIDVDDFTNIIIELNYKDVFIIINALKTRYTISDPYFEKIKVEKDWLYNVVTKLKSIAQTKTSIEKLRLEDIIIYNLEKIYNDYFS